MRRHQRMPAKWLVLSAASVCVVAALAGCSGASLATEARPAVSPSSATAVRTAVSSAAAGFAFTVAGVRPVLPNGSQDTHAQTPAATCDRTTFSADKALAGKVAAGFALAGFPASAELLTHFLSGKGTAVGYQAGSPISKQALASSAFRAVDREVQQAILGQLKAGRTRIRLPAALLPTVAFESKASDLYWGFRGTQGLTVTGSGTRENGRYVGTLSYVIRDSYGFPVSDTLGGFGRPMRYLQTVCGAPQHPGGAHWFPDTITLTVPFSHPA